MIGKETPEKDRPHMVEGVDGNGDTKIRILFPNRNSARKFSDMYDGTNGIEYSVHRLLDPWDPKVDDMTKDNRHECCCFDCCQFPELHHPKT